LSEAAFMTGLERNADVVHLCSYAPLFAHTEAWQWSPDLIWFDNLSSFGTPNYYVQKLYSLNSGTHVVPLTWSDKPLTGQDGMYASAVIDQRTREIIVKIVNSNAESRPFDLKLETSAKLSGTGKITVLSGSDIHAYNSIEKPNNVVTRETNITIKGKLVSLNTEPLSLTVVKISLK
jgi:alpha-L-arabinofuranosidase